MARRVVDMACGKGNVSDADGHITPVVTMDVACGDRKLLLAYWQSTSHGTMGALLCLLNALPKDVGSVVDVGAACGFLSCMAGAAGWSVLALEPNPITFSMLVHNVTHNRLADRVFPMQAAVWKEGDICGLRRRENVEQTSIVFAPSEVTLFAGYAPAVQLDTVLRFAEAVFGRVGLLKIDVEGAEHYFLPATDLAALAVARFIHLEQHDVSDGRYFLGDAKPTDLDALLAAAGFEPTATHPGLWRNARAVESL